MTFSSVFVDVVRLSFRQFLTDDDDGNDDNDDDDDNDGNDDDDDNDGNEVSYDDDDDDDGCGVRSELQL